MLDPGPIAGIGYAGIGSAGIGIATIGARFLETSCDRFGLGRRHAWQDAQGASRGVGGRDQTPPASVLAEQDSRNDGFGD